MDLLTMTAIVISVATVALLIINFHFLLYPLFPNMNPLRNATRVSLRGPSIFISDLHLKAGRPFQHSEAIRKVLESRQVSNLIVVGDLFDSPADARRIVEQGTGSRVRDILGFRDLPIKGFFVQGSPPHDPSLKEEVDLNTTSFIPLGQCVILEFNQMNVIAYHGHDLSWKGAIGHGWDRFISGLSLERAWKRFARVPDSEWVIFGHTHIPGIDERHKVANCGGWQSIGILVHPACTGLYLSPEDNSLEIVHFA